MKDWRRSPEPPGMMGLKEPEYQVHGNWGQPEALVSSSDIDPASPLPHTTPGIFRIDASTSSSHSRAGHSRGVSTQSLYSMALRVILRNISSVQDLGVLPYRHARPILEECRIEQLILLEESSPHLLTHTEEIWRRNCLRDFIHLRRKYDTPGVKEPKSWRKLYLRTKGETEQAKVDAARRIKDKYEQHRAEKEAKKLVVSDRPLHKPRTVRKLAAGGGGGGMSKGQSLMSKARSGSVAQAKLSGRSQGGVYRTQGRSRAVGAEIAPEAAGMGKLVRPMVAPRKVLGGASEGLAQMREFSKAGEADESRSTARAAPSSSSRRATDNSRGVSDGDSTGLPLLKPREVAAAPSLTPSSLSARPNTAGSSSPTAANTSRRPPSSPPPDIARTERRKVDFFGSGAKFSPSLSTTSSSPASTSTSGSKGIEVRGVKRAHSSSSTVPSSSRSTGTSSNTPSSSSSRLATSPSVSSPTTSFFPSSKAGNSGGVRVVQAKRARTQPDNADSPPAASPPSVVKATTSGETNGTAARSRPAPPVRQLFNGPVARMQDSRTARASPAALSSIFLPSSSPSRGRR